MKIFVLASTIAFVVFSGDAMAACSNGAGVNQVGNLASLLTGNTVCVTNGTGGWTWQEFHSTGSGGALTDWKLGSNTMDPTETVGTWSVSGSGSNHIVTHTYNGGGTYPYTVFKNGTGTTATYSFCGGTPPEIGATIKIGQGSCSSLAPIP